MGKKESSFTEVMADQEGYCIEELSENCSYIEVCYLLLYGKLPTVNELQEFEDEM